MASGIFPTIMNNFNVYSNGTDKLMGTGNEVKLPDYQPKTATGDWAGAAGEVEVPIQGQPQSMTIEINFDVLDDTAIGIIQESGKVDVTLRGSVQMLDMSDASIVNKPAKVVVKGLLKQITFGSFKKSESMGASITVEALYYSYTFGDSGEPSTEIDKLNNVCKIGGQDLSSDISQQI
jgi:P2 family phage contractile tail tube protein|nr:MAG TPA_asm: tail tube protein [Caudoviricetes sp.]